MPLAHSCAEYVRRYATKEAAEASDASSDRLDTDEAMSDVGTISDDETPVTG